MNAVSVYDKLRELNTVLIDDDQWVRNAMLMIFESENCPISLYNTAEEALEFLEKKPYDIIICEYGLSGMNGVDFFRKLAPDNKNCIKLLITGYGNLQIIRDALAIGVDDIIEKPFTTEYLEQSLDKLFKKKLTYKENSI